MDRMKELIKQAYDHNTLPDGIRKQRLSALLDGEEKRSGGITMTKKRISKKLICLTAAAAAAILLPEVLAVSRLEAEPDNASRAAVSLREIASRSLSISDASVYLFAGS